MKEILIRYIIWLDHLLSSTIFNSECGYGSYTGEVLVPSGSNNPHNQGEDIDQISKKQWDTMTLWGSHRWREMYPIYHLIDL